MVLGMSMSMSCHLLSSFGVWWIKLLEAEEERYYNDVICMILISRRSIVLVSMCHSRDSKTEIVPETRHHHRVLSMREEKNKRISVQHIPRSFFISPALVAYKPSRETSKYSPS